MIEYLKRICDLQSSYSPNNTPEMQIRGQLVRQSIPAELRAIEAQLREALGDFGSDFGIEASDGIGRKTEAPWIRFFSTRMSPTPRDGFYVVIHFAANGSAVFITVGCGSTIWARGELRPISDDELKRKTGWARKVIEERFGTLAPFTDQISLGARAALPRTFEKATAVAKRLSAEELDEATVYDLLIAAAERLREIYEAERTGRHSTIGAIVEAELEEISRPSPTRRGQGFGLSAADRKAIELRAMEMATQWLLSQGYKVTDRSSNSPFDIEAVRDAETIKVEVKGTTADGQDQIFMTRNEVELHSAEVGKTGLILVSGIRLEKRGHETLGTGGNLSAEIGWDIRTWDLKPIAYQVIRRPTENATP